LHVSCAALICCSSNRWFLYEDRQHAERKSHLTRAAAGEIGERLP